MTEQEAIDALEEHKKLIDKEYLKIRNSKAIEVVLNALKEKDKTIDLMSERVLLTEEEWEEIKEKNIYNVIKKDTHKLIKQYFENKVKE
jgi:hypothetical protein